MYSFETSIRVRYGETDKMGYAYYGNYPLYYEVARTEMLRSLGITYKQMEDKGIILPVSSLTIKYVSPAFYDDLLTIKVSIRKMPLVRIEFDYEVYNGSHHLINKGQTTLVFVDALTRKPHKAPDYFLDKIKKYFPDESGK